jgi:NAD(P)-dependent dehydrogenase (short-subunit alcohol dehydrogenase family)
MDAKVIVLTGVSRGLGRAMAVEFVRAGHMVVGCSRDPAAVERLRGSPNPPDSVDVVDIRDDAAVRAWAKRFHARFEAADLLINNAAVIHANAPLWIIPSDEFNAVIDVNIKGVAND